MRRLIAMPLATLLLIACTSKPEPQSELNFVDSDLFDKQLSRALGADLPLVTVRIIGTDATVNNVPERLDRWLSVVIGQGEERIQVRPDPDYPAPKSLVGVGISLALKFYAVASEWLFYAPAREYDALVLYEPASGRLTRIIFKRRPDT